MTHSEARNLSESECSLIAHTLRLGAQKYNENAQTCADAGHPRLAAQFDQQEKDARRLAELFQGDLFTDVRVYMERHDLAEGGEGSGE